MARRPLQPEVRYNAGAMPRHWDPRRCNRRASRTAGLAACGLALATTTACVHTPPPLQANALGPVPQSAGGARRGAGAAASPRNDQDVVMFVMGNIEFLLLHEIAHLLISEKNFPIVGPTENAADYIATWALLNEPPFDPTQRDRPLKFLLSAANAFAVAWRSALNAGAEVPYWGDHALSIQRYYQIACLMYGSNPTTFRRIPAVAGLPPARAEGCVDEYRRTDQAIRWLIQNYGRKSTDPPAPSVSVEIRYEKPGTLVSAHLVEALQSLQLLENTVDRLNERFALNRPFSLVVRQCGRPEAAWMPEQRELVICYELMDYIYSLGLSEQADRLAPALTEE